MISSGAPDDFETRVAELQHRLDKQSPVQGKEESDRKTLVPDSGGWLGVSSSSSHQDPRDDERSSPAPVVVMDSELSADTPSDIDVLDALMDEMAYEDALRKCDELVKYFMKRGPLSRKQTWRDFEMMEYMIENPLADLSVEERESFMNLSEVEKQERTENARWIHISGRNAFLNGLYGVYDLDDWPSHFGS